MNKRHTTEINAGSMADIAFLLLIFFLVTTTMEVDSGILRKLPPKDETAPPVVIHDRNILEVKINQNNKLMFDDQIIEVDQIQEIALNFIDNGGGLDANGEPCHWCAGKKEKSSSDHPSKAFISIQANRSSSYETYIRVVDDINKAYTLLRNKVAVSMYGENYTSLLNRLKAEPENRSKIMQKIEAVRAKYPLLLADAEMPH